MNIEEVLENIKRHLDYVNATKQKSIRDTEIEVMYKEIERLNNIINEIENDNDRTIEIIQQQPTGNDEWILNVLKGYKVILRGSEKE